MRKALASTLAAVTFGGALAATAAPAQAERYYSGRHHHHHSSGDKAAVAIAAGVAGLALGAALSSKGGGHYERDYYGSGDAPRDYGDAYRNGYSYDPGYDGYYGSYYGAPYADGYDRPYRVCVTRDRVWDPYSRRRTTIERRYPC